jgi:DUF438 domain-containing protein
MSELIENIQKKKDLLKHMILQLHKGEAPEAVRSQLERLLGEIPYDHVVAVEQELINQGLPPEEVLKFCDIHTAVLKGSISHKEAKSVPPGHPVHTFAEENRALRWELDSAEKLFQQVAGCGTAESLREILDQIQVRVNALTDVEKHYLRKENLLFPYLEKHGITGPPKIMWGKHDEVRELLKAAVQAMQETEGIGPEEAMTVTEMLLKPAVAAIGEMIYKEEQILLPMCMDTLAEDEWHKIYQQSLEIGFCLYDPVEEWTPSTIAEPTEAPVGTDRIQLPSGSFTAEELNSILNTIPFDLTFVDKEGTVRYFTQGRERIFARSRAILGRKVQLCHPPKSVHIVDQILDDFTKGRQERAPFWINLNGQFLHIEYFALKDKQGNCLGTLEVSQNLTEKRSLQGEQRLLNYGAENDGTKQAD